MTLKELAEVARVPVKHRAGDGSDSGDARVVGKNGHLYRDGGTLWIMFTDDGRKTPLTAGVKNNALKRMLPYLDKSRVYDLDVEFYGPLINTQEAFNAACAVLGVKRFKSTKGVSIPFTGTKAGK